MGLVALAVNSPAQRLAVHRDGDQSRGVRPGGCLGRRCCAGCLLGQPRSHCGVHRGWVGAGEHPPQGGLRRDDRLGCGVEPGQHLGGYVGDPPGDRGERAHAGQHRRRAQRQHHRDRMIPALIRAPIGHRGESFQQLRPLKRESRKIEVRWRPRLLGSEGRRVGHSDGRMGTQRSSGQARSWEGPFLLPELRSPTRPDTPKITDRGASRRPHQPRDIKRSWNGPAK